MRRFCTDRPTHNHVVAMFETSALAFELAEAATLEDLADRLAHLSERRGGALVSVEVRVRS